MRTTGSVALCVIMVAVSGCATRVDQIQQERRLSQQLVDQRKQIQSIQRELERMRGDVEGGTPRGGGLTLDERVQALEERLAKLEGRRPDGEGVGEQPPLPPPPSPPPPREVPAPQAVPPAPVEDAWTRDVQRDQQAIAASGAPERTELAPIMDSVARKDCGRAAGQLNAFATQKKDSPLAGNALYWSARCHALKGDRNQAISKFYDVVTKYPRGGKAAAALWEQGNLFLDMGDTSDARIALGKLIKDYPSSEEAARARKRLTELDR